MFYNGTICPSLGLIPLRDLRVLHHCQKCASLWLLHALVWRHKDTKSFEPRETAVLPPELSLKYAFLFCPTQCLTALTKRLYTLLWGKFQITPIMIHLLGTPEERETQVVNETPNIKDNQRWRDDSVVESNKKRSLQERRQRCNLLIELSSTLPHPF